LTGCAAENTAPPPVEPPPAEQPAVEPPVVAYPDIDRESKIPPGKIKITPETDVHPPILHSDEYEQPIPVPYPINTAGGEDSAFIMPDGKTIYFWFTPDVTVPPEKQLFDGVTGIYVSKEIDEQWQKPERVWLQDKHELSLDGGAFVQGDEMWFCSARKGNYRGVDMWTAEFKDGRWTNWKNAGKRLNVDYEVGELHITADGKEMYFHYARPGGKGQLDIWVTRNVNGEWQEPENVEVVNTTDNEGFPFITQDGNELWFTRTYMGTPAIFRSKKVNGQWQEPELIVSQFAAEPSVDNEGDVYFAHHFFKDGVMLEADIYVMYKK
jgi:hypothetical protein